MVTRRRTAASYSGRVGFLTGFSRGHGPETSTGTKERYSHYDVAQFDPGLYEGACLVIGSGHRPSPSPVPGTPRAARMGYGRGALPAPYAHVPADHAAQHHSATTCNTQTTT